MNDQDYVFRYIGNIERDKTSHEYWYINTINNDLYMVNYNKYAKPKGIKFFPQETLPNELKPSLERILGLEKLKKAGY